MVPVGQLASYGLIKESTFGVMPGAPTLFHGMDSPSFKPQNQTVARSPIRARRGQTFPGTAGYILSGTLDPESTPDTLAQMIAFAMGAQSAPSTTIVSAAVSATTSSGATALPVGTTRPKNVIPGMTLTVDTSSNQEELVVAAPALSVSGGVWSINFTSATTKSHANGATIVLTSTGAYASKFTFGALPSFTAEEVRASIDAIDYVGCKVDQYTIDIKPGTGLSCKFQVVAKDSVINASPASPTFSTKAPMAFENPNNAQYFGSTIIGPYGGVSTLSMSIGMNNNLDKKYFSGSSGRTVQDFPEGQRSGKVSLVLGFESNAVYKSFLGGNARAPIVVPALELAWLMAGSDVIDETNGVPYLFSFELPNLFPTGDAVPIKAGALQQTFEADLSESGSGNNDDLSIYYVGSASAAF